jgi:hypothetical protein
MLASIHPARRARSIPGGRARAPEPAPKAGAAPEPTLNDLSDVDERSEPTLLCAACKNPLTRPSTGISVNGSHQHQFMNPDGARFQVRCFATVPGSTPVGPPSDVWTWFPGYAWQPALCRSCLGHVGWRYARDASEFYALIRDRIVEGLEGPPGTNRSRTS